MMPQHKAAHETTSDRRAVTGWNVLATAKDHEQGHLATRLKRLGDFRWSLYLGLLMGRVEDHQAFFEQLRRSEEIEPGSLLPLARVIPLDTIQTIGVASLVSRLKADVLGYEDRIGGGHSCTSRTTEEP